MRRLFTLVVFAVVPLRAEPQTARVDVKWEKVLLTSKTTPTLQVVVNPPLRRGSAIHDAAFTALRDLGADYVRYVPWLPYPKLGVAELEPPSNGRTSWDFSLIDPLTIDFLEATKGHSVVLNFSTIPQWMYRTERPVAYPADPDEAVWNYEQGDTLRDTTFREAADYFARLLSWYTKGGFTDELGRRHESGHRYVVPFWEVLNEMETEHHFTPETYTRFYDAVVEVMRQVQPETKFVGLSLAFPMWEPQYVEYFLDPTHHKPGIPLDYVSYHFYASPWADQPADVQQHTFWAQANQFISVVMYAEAIRKRLSPTTGVMINEVGSILPSDFPQDSTAAARAAAIPESYWNLSGAMYAFLFGELSRQGIDVLGMSQLVGYPTQFPSVTMIDWRSGRPNARYWVLKLVKDHFGPGDRIVDFAQEQGEHPVFVYPVVAKGGERRIMLVNQRDRPIDVVVTGAQAAGVSYVDQETGFGPPETRRLTGEVVTLKGLAVAVVTLSH